MSDKVSEGSKDTWYNFSTCEGKNDDETYKKYHLMRVKTVRNLKWKHLPKLIC